VRRLEEGGYGTVGKANLHEFAYGVTSENPHFGTVPNPVAPGRSAGGSSGGSAAALAAGLADAALGTDSGGSIRIPAACCGIVGFKPTYGLVSLEGCFPLAPTYDHAGPMARTVEEVARMMELLAPGFEPHDPFAAGELRVAVAWTDEADPLVRERVEEVAERFPHRERIELPRGKGTASDFMREVADVHRGLFPEHADAYGADVREKLERCFRITDAEAEEAARARGPYRERCFELLEGFDLLLTPTLGFVAPRVGEITNENRDDMTRFTYPFDVLGWPALALPCGPAEDGLPASVQIVGRPGDDALVLAVGASLERGTPGPS
jgi:Asp-tRNA(Asn)/Glu-tRNA(Gln) amidotransferase A subunit family amidase